MVGRIGGYSTRKENEASVKLVYGGGLNTRGSVDEIDPRECADGENFILDFKNREFRPRPPFDIAGTAPNGAPIRGFAQLLKRDGTTSLLVQADTVIYHTDFTTWTQVGTVSGNARIRGPRFQNWELDQLVIITDVARVAPVMQWDGTTLQNIAHNLGGTFIAAHCAVVNERALYANVISNSVSTPHLLVGSEREDHTNLSVSDRPASSLGEADPWYLPIQDLKAINGLVNAFGVTAISTKKGQIWQLTGESAKDFAIDGLYPDSAADGDEALIYTGSDIVYGRQGRIESLGATQKFGDVETDDLSRHVAPTIEGFGGWRIAYNSRLQRIYFHPNGEESIFVYFKPISETNDDLSPWSKFTTSHFMRMNPTAMMTFFDPSDGLEYTFLGDETGKVYRLEGSGTSGDAGTDAIRTFRVSPMVSAPALAENYNVEGQVKFRRGDAVSFALRVLWQGERVFNVEKTLAVPGITDRVVYGGPHYYGDGSVYGNVFEGKIFRERFAVEGQGHDFQVETEVISVNTFAVPEIELALSVAS